MRFQSLLLAASVTLAGFTAAQYGQAFHNRRNAAILRARDAIAEVDYYDTILKRNAASDYEELLARDAEADYFEELVARDAEPDYYEELFARDAEPDYYEALVARDEYDHFQYRRGNRPSRPTPGPVVAPHPPQHDTLKHCALCGTMCTAGETWHRSKVHHPGANGQCVDLPGQ